MVVFLQNDSSSSSLILSFVGFVLPSFMLGPDHIQSSQLKAWLFIMRIVALVKINEIAFIYMYDNTLNQ